MLHSSNRLIPGFTLLALIFSASTAWAQFGGTPTDGLVLPETSIVHRDDALSLELNPAGLAFIEGMDLQLATTSMDNDILSGVGLFAAGSLFHHLGLGGGIQWVSNPDLGGELKKFTLGVAGRAGPFLSAGLAFNYFDSDDDRAVDTFSSWDGGIQMRLSDLAGLSASVRDFNTPTLGGTALEPRYVMGGALRFDEGRYRIELDGIYDDGPEDWFLRGRIALEPLDGLTLFAEAQTTAVDDFDLASLRGGLSVSLGRSTLTGAVIANNDGSVEYGGTAVALRVASVPMRTMARPSGLMVGMTLSGDFPERSSHSILGSQRGFLDLLMFLDALARDERIAGLVLTLENVSLGASQHWEVRRALEQLRARGKYVAVVLSTADFGDLYLASAANWVSINPGTAFFPRGMATHLTYFGQLFENIGVQPEFVRIGEYKSSPESLSEREPSEATLEAVNTFYDDVFSTMVQAIADGRGSTAEEIRAMIDQTPLTPEQARDRGLVDEVCFPDEVEDRLGAELGRRVRISQNYDPRQERSYRWDRPPAVAVVHIDGDIMEGTSGNLPMVGLVSGHRTLVDLLERLRQRRDVAAVVLRVDSPGGSAWASEAIWRAIERLDERVPVVVSMGNTAASGGYYVAAGGREIMATDLTLTGSIGIFAGHFSTQGLLTSLGIHRFPIQRGENANLFGIDEPWTDAQRESAMRGIQQGYDTFLERVADARGREPSEIDAVGRGHIWSGQRAQELGLVDEIGGVMDALARAKVLAGLAPDAEVRVLSLPERGLLAGLPLIGDRTGVNPSAEAMADLATLIEALGLDEALRLSLLYGDGRPAARLLFEVSSVE